MAVAEVLDAPEKIAAGDAGGGEEDVRAAHEVVAGEHLVEVVTAVDRGLALLVVAGPQLAEDLAAEALDRRGGDDALGRTADPPEQVDLGVLVHGDHRGGDVAVGDEA